MPIDHLYFPWRNVQILCPVLVGLFASLLMSFKCSLYIWIEFLLSDIWLTNIDLILVGGMRYGSPPFFCMWISSCPSTICLKACSSPHWIIFVPSLKISCPQVLGFISGFSILFHWFAYLSLYQYHTVSIASVLYCKFWNQKCESLKNVSSFSKVFWLFWVPWISLWTWESACQFLQKKKGS